MGYLSKAVILRAYKELSQLTNDPSAQGATQATSALRYIFALDEFTKKYNRDCDTSNKEDRDAFISFVGNVVSVNKESYTANFFNAIKDNQDYAVGSNFFSVNVVKNSVINPNEEFTFPKRGNNPLFIVKGGRLIEKSELLVNLSAFLHTPTLRNAFAVWLVRFDEVDRENVFSSIYDNLQKRYSAGIIQALQLENGIIKEIVGQSINDNPYSLSLSDFSKSSTKSQSRSFQPIEHLADQVREAFVKYWNIIDQHGADYNSFIGNFENTTNPSIQNLGIGYDNVFQIVDIEQYNSIINKIATDNPEVSFILNGRQNHGWRYEVASTHLHYKNFLSILNASSFLVNVEKEKRNRIETELKTNKVFNKSYLRAMRTKPFLLLAGISGTGKSRIVKQMAFDSCPKGTLRADATSPGNYCLVEVKPNWHDSTELLGYESKIGGAHYVLTPFIKFLAKAMLYPEVPFFVCLDEMNLAPVEQYFAEFLSVLESRTKIENRIVSEPLVKADIFKKYQNLFGQLFSVDEEEKAAYDGAVGTSDPSTHYGKETEVYESLKREGLRIPQNVVVIGTVNMDETTHQFSRKVIDRAMTIEMNLPEGDPFMDFYNNSSQLAYHENPTSASLYLSTEVKASDVIDTLADADAEKTEQLKCDVAKFLGGLNEALDGTPFKVAYRVQNELLLYFYQLWREDNAADWERTLTTSCDQILMMKVLPRIEGDEELLEKPLERLADFCVNYPCASKKIAEMKSRLDQSHFTSFWP